MYHTVFLFTVSIVACTAYSDLYQPINVTRSTISGIAEYRSALTLDWLSHEDNRQRELALVFETEADVPPQVLASDCINYAKPAPGKVAKLLLELLKNLEGDEGKLIPEMVQALIRAKLLIETSLLEAEPDLDSLVKTPGVMMGEPHTTFPRILAMTWMAVTDSTAVKKNGWCAISKITRYLLMTRPTQIAKEMRHLDPVIARTRFIMEEFIQHITPSMYEKQNLFFAKTKPMDEDHSTKRAPKHRIHSRPPHKVRTQPEQLELKQGTDATIPSLPPTSSERIEHNLIDQSVLFERQSEPSAAVSPRAKVLGANGFPFCLFLIKVYF